MQEKQPLKRCSKCHEEKPATPEYFHRHKASKIDGLYPACKVCKNAYDKTPKGREVVKRKTARRLKSHPEKKQAKYAVRRAVKSGKLPRVSTVVCAMCASRPAQEYHHGSYEWEHRIHVIPLCKECHTAEHEIEKRAKTVIAQLKIAA